MIRAVTVGDIAKIMREEFAAGEKAVKSAMSAAGKGIQDGWRSQIMTAGLGLRLPRTIRTRSYPIGQNSMNSAALVWANAPEIISAFDRGVTIRSNDGFWLAIPTPEAGNKGVGRARITPGGYEQRTGLRLRFVYRENGPSLLVADGARLDSRGRAVMSRAKVRADGTQRGAVTAVIFWLVPQVTLPKKLDLTRDIDTWATRIPDLIVKNWPE
ncbi:DUF6441 family protein [Devosia sp. YIM 151766]|uniref:DUF6441 family protein n=1 Tax=Devosia sp. YIM 151766 TaxID=3017325 RepID=UPI00255CF5FB|nr:DUF6441 family protein [Devosia sp. YIM 151766]WIY52457.1 DUF6441 family protein [Devosia sp. YIM 151766]